MTYVEKTLQIIKESIKSAIFIDEKARTFFQTELTGSNEEILSENLFSNFKENGISLAIHKFIRGHESDPVLKKYLFDGRDLVLLDWKLDGTDGEDLSLAMLSEVTLAPHINFCAIYTSDPQTVAIFKNLVAYFSGNDASYFHQLRNQFEFYEDQLLPIFARYDLIGDCDIRNLIKELMAIDLQLPKLIKQHTQQQDLKDGYKMLYIAFSNFHLPEQKLHRPSIISVDNNTLVINNTIIAILQKDAKNDVSGLLALLADQFAKSENSFTQLLGFEMQSIFGREGSFIDSNLLKVSLEALLQHRNYILHNEDTDIPFKILIKNVLIEHATMRLRTAKLALLEDAFLDEISKEHTAAPSDDALSAMNVFYNSVKVEAQDLENPPSLNFGDVFDDGDGNYYLCITALCDCYIPSKIDSNYYFAKGIKISKELALTLGDTAFMSFLPGDVVVSWILPETDKFKYDENSTEGLKSAINYFKQFKYKPVYVKPVLFTFESNKIVNNQIKNIRMFSKDAAADLGFSTFNYITTIRPNYTQRIANHAFTHPVRVGVDFVKKFPAVV